MTVEERAHLLAEALRSAWSDAGPAPTAPPDIQVVAAGHDPTDEHPDLILRASHETGFTEASSYAIQREALLWAAGGGAGSGRLRRVQLRATEGTTGLELNPNGDQDEEKAWETARRFLQEIAG